MTFVFLRQAAMGAVAGASMIVSSSDAFALAYYVYYPVEEACPYYQELEEGSPVNYDFWRFNRCDNAR